MNSEITGLTAIAVQRLLAQLHFSFHAYLIRAHTFVASYWLILGTSLISPLNFDSDVGVHGHTLAL